jgi:uncharacterized membrane protein
MKRVKPVHMWIIVVILLSFAIGILLYPQMPDQMASHWNAQGEVDDTMCKFWGLFLMPIITLAMYLLFLAIPRIDPLKKNIEKFRKYFDWFIYLIILFLFYIYLLTIIWNLGYRFEMGTAIIPALAVLFYIIGVVVERAKRNWFIGIRTPWTLSSDVVWDKTHKLGGKLFKIVAVITLIAILFPHYTIWLVIGPVIAVTIFTIVYSYVEYQKVEKHVEKKAHKKKASKKK